MDVKTKVVIIGAGFVGSTITYTLAVQRAASEIVLIDVAKDKVMAEVDDIKHGLWHLGDTNLYAGDYSDIKGADLIILTAGANRKPGETRLDLAQKNVAIAKACTDEIMKHYDGGAILIVANPVDILTYMVTKWTGLPAGRVFGSGTSLDSARLRSILSDITHVDVANIHGYILGEHGDSQFVAWSNTHVAGIKLESFCRKRNIEFNDDIKATIHEQVKKSGSLIIQRKGATFYGIAVCVSNIVNAVLHNSNTIRTVGSMLNGEFGLSDVVLSLPAIVNGNGASSIVMPDLLPAEVDSLIASAKACRSIIDQIQKK